MKAALVVFFAVVAMTSASIVPLGLGVHGLSGIGLGHSGIGLSGLGLSGVGIAAPWGHGATVVQQNAAALHAPLIAHAPVWSHAPIVAAAHAPHGAVAVNANRGSVHVAPLPGHIASSSQLNLAPAPGTW